MANIKRTSRLKYFLKNRIKICIKIDSAMILNKIQIVQMKLISKFRIASIHKYFADHHQFAQFCQISCFCKLDWENKNMPLLLNIITSTFDILYIVQHIYRLHIIYTLKFPI